MWNQLLILVILRAAAAATGGKQYFLQRNPGSLHVILGKIFVFAFTWSFGGNFKRQDEMEDDGGISRRGGAGKEVIEIDVATDFDNFVHELFEVEPPVGMRPLALLIYWYTAKMAKMKKIRLFSAHGIWQ